jgi:hypothetical protein
LKEISLEAREIIKNFSEESKRDIEIIFYRMIRRVINEKKSFSFSDDEKSLLGSELKGLNSSLIVVYSDVYYYDDLVVL